MKKYVSNIIGEEYIIPEDIEFEFEIDLGSYYANKLIITSQGEFKTNGIASSRIVRMSAEYTFKKKGDAKVLFTKTATATSPYNLLNNQFSTEMLKNEAVKLSIEDISNQIYFAIITYFTEK